MGGGDHRGDGGEQVGVGEGGFVDDDGGGGGGSAVVGGEAGEGEEAGAVGEDEGAGEAGFGGGGETELAGEGAEALEEERGVAGDAADQEVVGAGVAEGEVEGLGGGGLGFAGLAGADEGEALLGGVEDAGLSGVRGEGEMGGDPGGGGLALAVGQARGRGWRGVSGSVDELNGFQVDIGGSLGSGGDGFWLGGRPAGWLRSSGLRR